MEKINILIVEDDPIIGADIEDRMMDFGYGTIGPFPTGEAALVELDKAPLPDLIIMDINLEGEWDGIETARNILERHGALPIIFLTSNSDDVTFAKAKLVQPAAFLSKPFRGRDLKHAIELAISESAKQVRPEENKPEDDNTFLLKDRMFIKVKERMQRLFFSDIQWVEADDYYCKVHALEKEFLVTKTLKKFSDELAGRPEFLRVHRSFIVNLRHVEEIGELYLHIGNNKIAVSKNMREELLHRL